MPGRQRTYPSSAKGDLIRRLCEHLTTRHPLIISSRWIIEETKVYFFATIIISELINRSNPNPPTKHDRGVLVRAGGETMELEGGNISPFHEVAVWPFDVIIH